jgi:capsular exopolysaccharide synthesis family protein
MSTFSRALQQAERDRAHRGREAPPEPAPLAPEAVEPPSRQVRPDAPLGGESAHPPGPPRTATRPVETPSPADAPAPAVAEDARVEEHLVSLLAPGSAAAEHYRTLRHLVEALPRTGGGAVVGVTSASRGDGKTTTAINLAGALGQAANARVLIVDADLRSPAVAARLAIDPAEAGGLAEAINLPAVRLDRLVHARPPFNVSVLPAGAPPASPYETLRDRRVGELLEEARREFDFVVVDTPPLVPVPDCRVLEPWVDGFFVVVAAHRTPRTLVEEALRVLPPAKVLGIVFNMDDSDRRYYPYSPYAAPRNGNGARPGRWLRGWGPEQSREW